MDIKIKNINLIYFQNNKLFASLDNCKTILSEYCPWHRKYYDFKLPFIKKYEGKFKHAWVKYWSDFCAYLKEKFCLKNNLYIY